MNDAIKRALRTAEDKVLTILANAARLGDLAGVDTARRIVGSIRLITAGLDENGESSVDSRNDDKCAPTSSEIQAEPKRKHPRKYPEFFVRHETLYRLAWSRKKNQEYEHKVPRHVVREVVRTLESLAGTDRTPLSVESILAKINRTSPIQIPQYQVYVVVGWLRQFKHIEQVGRDGYRVPSNIARIAEEQWGLLASRMG